MLGAFILFYLFIFHAFVLNIMMMKFQFNVKGMELKVVNGIIIFEIFRCNGSGQNLKGGDGG